MAFRKAKITPALVRALQPGETVADIELSGFMVRRQQSEARIYAVRKSVRGERHYETIGEDGREGWTERRAREEALLVIAALRKGRDPAAERAKAKGMPTVAEWAQTVLDARRGVIKPGTARNYDGFIRNHLKPSPIGALKLDQLTRADVAAQHRRQQKAPRAANMVLTFVGVLLAEAIAAKLVSQSALDAVQIKRYPERKRERFLTDAELARLGETLAEAEASGAEDPYAIAAIRLLLLTGCRVDEILTCRWEWIDVERGILALPDSKTAEKPILLSPAALEVLAAIPRVAGNPFVIIGRKVGQHFVGLSKVWSRIRTAAKLAPITLPSGKIEQVRIHDLRHSFASFNAADGASLLVIGKLLGHKNPSTTARYAHLVDDAIRRSTAAVGRRVAVALKPRATAEPVLDGTDGQ